MQNAGVLNLPGLVRALVAATALAVLPPGIAAAAAAPTNSATPCGAASLATVAAVDAAVAKSVYGGEIASREVVVDAGHVSSSQPLLRAVAADDRAAVERVVQQLVYHGGWHIVRLRVLDAAGTPLADFGGPYVIAPVHGVLRLAGRPIGSFVMSVQDDVGYAKLERRFVGDPIAIYVDDVPVVNIGARFPARPPIGPALRIGGTDYAVVSATFAAFPSGTLSAVILVAPPTAALTGQSCAAVHVAEVGRIAVRFARLFSPLYGRYAAFVETLHSYTGATIIVRIGTRAIAGSEGLGPPVIPDSGEVDYQGTTWWVFSFAATPPARIYVLVASAALGTASTSAAAGG